MDATERLKVALLPDGARRVGKGAFSIDAEKARDKLERYRLPNPRSYPVLLVQAAVASGATRIEFEMGTRELRARFAGATLDAGGLRSLEESLYGVSADPLERARQRLAMAVHTSLALPGPVVEVWSGGSRLTVESGKWTVADAPQQLDGTEIRVRESLTENTALRFLRQFFGRSREEEFLAQRCHACSIAVIVDGAPFSRGLAHDHGELLCARVVAAPGVRVAVGLHPADAACQTELLLDGVVVETLDTLDGVRPLPHVRARIECSQFVTDISDSSVLRDAAFTNAVGVLERAVAETLAALAEGGAAVAALPGRRLISTWLARYAPPRGESNELVPERLRHVPLFLHAADAVTLLSLAELERGCPSGPLPVVSKKLGRWRGKAPDGQTHPLILAPENSQERVILARVFGVSPTSEAEHRRHFQRLINIREWKARPARPVLPKSATWLVSKTFKDEGVQGELGLSTLEDPSGTVGLIKDGHLLWSKRVRGPVRGVHLVVEAGFTPLASYGGVQADETFVKALAAAGDALDQVFAQLFLHYAQHSKTLPPRETEALRAACCEYLALVTGDAGADSWTRTYALFLRRAAEATWSRDFLHLELRLSSADPHPAASLPLLRRLGGGCVSLNQLYVEAQAGGPIRYQDPEDLTLGFTESEGAAQTLLLTPVELRLVEQVLGTAALRCAASPAREQTQSYGASVLSQWDTEDAVSSAASESSHVKSAAPAPRDGLAAPDQGAVDTPFGAVYLAAPSSAHRPAPNTVDPRGLQEASTEPHETEGAPEHHPLIRALYNQLAALLARHPGLELRIALDADVPVSAEYAIRVVGRDVSLNRRHPLVAGCLGLTDDPIAIGLLASAVAGELARADLEALSDAERVFNAELVARVLASRK